MLTTVVAKMVRPWSPWHFSKHIRTQWVTGKPSLVSPALGISDLLAQPTNMLQSTNTDSGPGPPFSRKIQSPQIAYASSSVWLAICKIIQACKCGLPNGTEWLEGKRQVKNKTRQSYLRGIYTIRHYATDHQNVSPMESSQQPGGRFYYPYFWDNFLGEVQ